jgi:DNA-binding CsgD family transcriptional regulator
MSVEDDALDIIGELYEAALEPERLPQTLARVTGFVGAGALRSLPEAIGLLSVSASPQRERLQLLYPHLLRAAEIVHRLQDARARAAGALGALGALGSGVVIVDERGAVTFTNTAARRIFAENDGLKLRGRPFAVDPQAQKALDAAIQDCLRPHAEPYDCSRGLRVPRPSKRPDYVVRVTSLGGAAIVFISDPASELTVDETLLRREYGLTRAESRLAELLLNGETLASAAKRLRVSEATAKTQLQHIFQKTRTHRQPELVKLLLSLASGK